MQNDDFPIAEEIFEKYNINEIQVYVNSLEELPMNLILSKGIKLSVAIDSVTQLNKEQIDKYNIGNVIYSRIDEKHSDTDFKYTIDEYFQFYNLIQFFADIPNKEELSEDELILQTYDKVVKACTYDKFADPLMNGNADFEKVRCGFLGVYKEDVNGKSNFSREGLANVFREVCNVLGVENELGRGEKTIYYSKKSKGKFPYCNLEEKEDKDDKKQDKKEAIKSKLGIMEGTMSLLWNKVKVNGKWYNVDCCAGQKNYDGAVMTDDSNIKKLNKCQKIFGKDCSDNMSMIDKIKKLKINYDSLMEYYSSKKEILNMYLLILVNIPMAFRFIFNMRNGSIEETKKPELLSPPKAQRKYSFELTEKQKKEYEEKINSLNQTTENNVISEDKSDYEK